MQQSYLHHAPCLQGSVLLAHTDSLTDQQLETTLAGRNTLVKTQHRKVCTAARIAEERKGKKETEHAHMLFVSLILFLRKVVGQRRFGNGMCGFRVKAKNKERQTHMKKKHMLTEGYVMRLQRHIRIEGEQTTTNTKLTA